MAMKLLRPASGTKFPLRPMNLRSDESFFGPRPIPGPRRDNLPASVPDRT